jgi:hypothetical protein
MRTITASFLLTAFCLTFSCGMLQAQNALHFDGVDDKVDCGNTTAVDLTGTSITLEAWIRAESWATNIWEGNIINKEQNGPSNGYMLRVGEGGKINFNLGDGSFWNEQNTPTTVLNLNTWYHLAATYDGTYMRLYIDGQVTDSIPKSISFTSTNTNLTIGSHNSYNRYFHGKIEEVRIWDVARTRQEIQQSMNSSLCGDENGLRAYYKFDQGSAGGGNSGLTTLTDELGNSNGTLQNFSLSGNTSNWIGGRTFNAPFQRVSLNEKICNGAVFTFAGQQLSTAGTYYDTIAVSSGCDSLIELNLSVDVLNAGITADTVNHIYWSTDTGRTYLWVDCNANYAPLPGPGPGQINQSFTPLVSGNYAVVVSSGAGCSDTSACESITIIGLEELRRRLELEAFPNPFTDRLEIRLGAFGTLDRIEVYDANGRMIYTENELNQTSLELNTANWAPALYRVDFITEKEERIPLKVVKQ